MFRNNKFGLKDALVIIGVAALFYGIFTIYPPAAFIVLGAGFILLGFK